MQKLLIALPLLLMACAFSEQPVEREPFVYRLDSGDVVRVAVFRHPDLSGEYRVDGGGMVAIPFVGSIAAEASTARELEERIEERLVAGGFLAPHVLVEVIGHRPVYVIGSVSNSGIFEYIDGMTVLDVLTMAGAIDFRDIDGLVTIHNNDAFIGYVTYDTPVYPGDVVTVAERFF